MNKYSYKWMTENGWSKRGIRVEAENSKDAFRQVVEILEARGHHGPHLVKWRYVK